MRNLSKVLALVLSLAFVLTMFAGAIATVPETTNYSDAAELSAAGSEAVNVLSALGIVNGYTDGSFQPASLVTRAEFAKMMSVALANTDVTTFYSVSTLPFNDTFDAWCIPYINYCYLNELMVGYGDGYMLPKNNVTGFEAIKMVLVGLGYDPKVEGLEGSAWQTNTAKLANRIGLLKNLETENIYAAFDREATAILVRNAIYTETVEYVGSSAVSTGKTLGEKVYDLMDIRGIVVGNEYGYLGANWTNAAITDQTTTIKPVYYIDYQNQVVKGQTIFAYRDFTGAATTGGYYVPRIVHVALASDYADLGRAYRILTTGAQNPTNTNEVRKIYGVIEEIATGDVLDYVYKKGILSDGGLTGGVNDKDAADLTGKIGAMLDSAQIANVNVTKDSVQNNIFIDGKAASYADAVAHIAKYAKSSAPYYYVDNDNDGIVDYVALWTYTVAKVLAVAEDGKLTLSGVGTAKTYITDDTIAVGDYVAYYGDKQFNYVDKLEVYVGNVTGYSKNSNHGSTPVDGLSVTEAGGVYTINGKSYTFGSLVGTLNDATQAYFENLMGTGSAALYGTTLQFVFDGSYIVAAFVTEDSYWANYAIFVYSNPGDVTLSMPHVRLYTDDNEYKDFYVATINGNQIYNSIVTGGFWSTMGFEFGQLVRYEELGNQQIALYTADYANVNDKYTDDIALGYNFQTGNWEDSIRTPYNWKNGVVFVWDTSIDQEGDDDIEWIRNHALVRAYWYGEFQPAGAYDFLFMNNTSTQLIYADGLNGVPTIKAASLSFRTDYLPGLVLRSDMKWGTIMGTTSVKNIIDTEDAKAKYAYEVSILKPWSGGTETITVYADHSLVTFNVGDIYKLYMSEDGVCRRFEIAATGDDYWYDYLDVPASETSKDTDGIAYMVGGDYLELGTYKLSYVVSDGADGYYLYVKRPYMDGNILKVADEILHLAAGVDAYFTKGLFTTGIEAYNYLANTSSLGLTLLNKDEAAKLTVYADLNPGTNEIASVWFNKQDDPAIFVDETYVTLAKYDVNTGKAVYEVDGIAGQGIVKVEATQAPNEIILPVGIKTECTVTFRYEYGVWTVKSVDDIKSPYKWVSYDRTTAEADVYTAETLEVYPNASTKVTYKIGTDLQGFWVREGIFARVDPSYGSKEDVNPDFYLTWTAAQDQFIADKISYNPDNVDGDGYDYEKFDVLTDSKNNVVVIVYTDVNGIVDVEAPTFPYNNVKASA